MKTLNVAEARKGFSALIDDLRLGGEDVVISKYGHPVAMLVSYRPAARPATASGGSRRLRRPRRPDWRDELGLRDDKFVLPADFDEPMDYLWEVFDENAEEPTP